MSASNQQARALAFLRIAVGLLFLIFAQYKLLSTHFIWGAMANYIGHFIQGGCYPFMRSFLKNIILPHAVFFGGLAMMLLYLFSSNYPGRDAPLWEYFGASLDHSVLALCFLTFLIGRPNAVWALRFG